MKQYILAYETYMLVYETVYVSESNEQKHRESEWARGKETGRQADRFGGEEEGWISVPVILWDFLKNLIGNIMSVMVTCAVYIVWTAYKYK